VFPFWDDSPLRSECGAASICNGAVDNGLSSLLAQFGLTPKSRRGLGAGEVVDPLAAL
jgi:hypothetical protein